MDNFEIALLQERGEYAIKDFDDIAVKIHDYVENECLKNLVIQDESDYKALKDKRTEIRKFSEKLKDSRLAISEAVLGKLNLQLRGLEKMLNLADKTLKDKKDEWDKAHKEEKPAGPIPLVIRVCALDPKILAKVKDYAIELGCAVEE